MKHKLLCAVSVLPALLVMPAMAVSYDNDTTTNLNTVFADGKIDGGLKLDNNSELSWTLPSVSIKNESGVGLNVWHGSHGVIGGESTDYIKIESSNRGVQVAYADALAELYAKNIDIKSDAAGVAVLLDAAGNIDGNIINIDAGNYGVHANSATTDNAVLNLGTEKAKNIDIKATKVGVYSQTGYTTNVGNKNSNIKIASETDQAVLAIKGVLNIVGDTVDISSTSDDWGTVHSQNNAASDTTAHVNITANKINITSKNTQALVALSEGQIDIVGDATISGKTLLATRGNAVTNINVDGKHTSKLNGNVRFDYDGPTSGTAIDAFVNITLAGAESYWNGNTIASYRYQNTTEPGEEKFDVNEFVLNIQDGAVWNATKVEDVAPYQDGAHVRGSYYIALNTLNINNGTVNILDTERGIMIDKSLDVKNATFAGGPLNIANGVDAVAVDSSFDTIVLDNGASIAFSGETTLDNGIAGNGTVEFDTASVLNAKLDTTKIVADTVTTNGAKLNMIIANGASDDTYEFVTANELDRAFTINDNALYNLTMDNDGMLTIAKKSAAETTAALADAGVEANEAAALSAITSVATTGNDQVDAVFATIGEAVQTGDIATAKKAVKVINPEEQPVAQAVATSVQNQVVSLVSNRMGRAGGDVELTGGGVWAQGMFNKSKLNDHFHGYTRGVTAGIDEIINHDVTLGLGYSFSNTDVHANTGRSTDIDSNTLFLYAQYKPNQWYVNGIAHYTVSTYKETADVLGVQKSAKHDVDSFGGSVMTGYRFASGATPELGVRYLNISQDDYVDSFGVKVSADTNQYLTTVAGVKYVFDIFATDALVLHPELRAAATYDVLSDKAVSTVTMPGGAASYVLDGDRLSRVGGEFGAGIAANICGLELSVNYDLAIHKNYTSQTGMVKVRYEF